MPSKPTGINEEIEFNGDLVADIVWDPTHVYVVTNTLKVLSGVTLTILPDTEVLFGKGAELRVEGRLIADGSSIDHLIEFRPKELLFSEYTWKGISIFNTNDSDSHLKFVRIKGAEIGLRVFSSSPLVSHCFLQSNRTGIEVTSSTTDITYCEVTGGIYGIVAHKNPANVLHCTISRNDIGLLSYYWIQVHYSNLINLAYDVRIEYDIPRTNKIFVDATDNWWGTILPTEIEQKIFDAEEDSRVGQVRYEPIAHEPYEGARP